MRRRKEGVEKKTEREALRISAMQVERERNTVATPIASSTCRRDKQNCLVNIVCNECRNWMAATLTATMPTLTKHA